MSAGEGADLAAERENDARQEKEAAHQDAGRTYAGSRARPAAERHAATRRAIERAAVELFRDRGYAGTTVQQIATAAGVSRRTYFRHFTTKADALWGDFDGEVARLRAELAASPADAPVMTAVRRVVVDCNAAHSDLGQYDRERLHLLLSEPEIIARSMTRFGDWRRAVEEFVAERRGCSAQDLEARVVGECTLGATVASYRAWFGTTDTRVVDLIDEALAALEGLDLDAISGGARG